MAYINEEQASFYTKSFLIRFCEEEVEINEFCHFRAEVDVLPNYLLQTYILETELIHSVLNPANPKEISENKTTHPTTYSTNKDVKLFILSIG